MLRLILLAAVAAAFLIFNHQDAMAVHIKIYRPSIHVHIPSPAEVAQAAKNAANAAAQRAKDAAAAAANAAKQAAEAAAKATEAATKAAVAAHVTPGIVILDAVTGKPIAPALKSTVAAQANALQAAGVAASTATEQAENIKVTVAGAIAGNVGKTTVQIITGPERLQEEFASTAVLEAADLLNGANANQLIAAPLAAALRAAQAQFGPSSQPVPDAVKQRLGQFYTAAQLANARYAIGTISISIPDLIIHAQKTFEGNDFAVTVGNIIVFSKDPADNYHWWAHELQHTVQYSAWGIDKFAFQYVTTCHSVEQDAEDHAQAAVPVATPAKLGC